MPRSGGMQPLTIVLIIIGAVVGLIALVVIIGIVAAVAVPNLVQAKQAAQQKETIVQMRRIQSLMEIYAIDRPGEFPGEYDHTTLTDLLVPEFVAEVPSQDAWGNDFMFEAGPSGFPCIISIGPNGIREAYPPYSGHADAGDDLVLYDGHFVRYPAGAPVN
ncbi:MAG: type II secretion system protein [Acidobacteria bacterium]|nr:type II secretion system protein [Acidobacteriota bacterium]